MPTPTPTLPPSNTIVDPSAIMDQWAYTGRSTMCVPQLIDGKLKILCAESDVAGVLRFWIEEPKWSPNVKK